MSDTAGDEPEGGTPATGPAAEADAPKGRAAMGEDATARDWTRTRTPGAPEPADGDADVALLEAAQEAAQPPGDDESTVAIRLSDLPAGVVDTPPGEDAPAPPAAEPVPEPVAASYEEPPRQIVRATGPPRRPPLLVQGLWPALLAGGLIGAASLGVLPLAVAVLGVQVFLVLGALALLDAPASGGAFLVATGTVLAADAVVLLDDGSVDRLAGVVGVGLVASLLHQLLRKARSRVTESLADTFVVVVFAVGAACLVALEQVDGGDEVLRVSLAATAAVLLAGRIGDRLAPRPMLAVGSTRGWPGLLLGLGAGVSAALLVADRTAGDLPLQSAALLGLVVASTVATADLAVDLGAAELRAGWRDARRVAALRPTALLLPYAVLGPVALLAGRLVLS